MAFQETRFFDDIGYDSQFGAGFKTNVIVMDSGAESRISRVGIPRHKYNLSYGLKDRFTQLPVLRDVYIAMRGSATGFRFKDWMDYASTEDGTTEKTTVSDDDQVIASGDGSEVDFQLVKNYTAGGVTRKRAISKPVDGTLIIALDGTPEGDFTVNTTSGLITFDDPPGAGVNITAGYEFDVPVRFSEESDELIGINISSFDTGGTAISLVEIINELPFSDEFYFGGAQSFNLSAGNEVTLTELNGRVINFGLNGDAQARFPDYTTIPLGGPYFFLWNNGGGTLTVVDHTDAVVGTITASSGSTAVLGLDSDGSTPKWFMFG